jgi:hypothetical protein
VAWGVRAARPQGPYDRSRVYRLGAASFTMRVGMGTIVLRVIVVMLVMAAGMVARVSYERLANPTTPSSYSPSASAGHYLFIIHNRNGARQSQEDRTTQAQAENTR